MVQLFFFLFAMTQVAECCFFREGVNALDAAFLAYSSISVLRQQMKPTHRSHGIVKGRDWISNGDKSASVNS